LSDNLLNHTSIQNISNLNQLYLNDNRLIRINSTMLTGLFSLEILDISSNNLNYIDLNGFRDLINLKQLFLYSNQLKMITDYTFFNLNNLTILYLNENELEYVEEKSFKHLNQLVELDLSDNGLEDIELFSSGLDSLQSLYLSKNECKIKKSTFSNLVNLKELDLASNSIENLELGIFDHLHKLEYLWLNDNYLTKIDNIIFNFNNTNNSLKELNIEYNQIKDLKRNYFNDFKQLERICFYGNENENGNFMNNDIDLYNPYYDGDEETIINRKQIIEQFCSFDLNKSCILVYEHVC